MRPRLVTDCLTATGRGRRGGSVKGDGDEARAQQHKAGCCQREKSIGDEIVATHDAPALVDDRPILLKISESPCRQADAAAAISLKCVREEDAGAEQAENCRYRFDHRRGPYAPSAKDRMRLAQSKRFRCAAGFGRWLMIPGNSVWVGNRPDLEQSLSAARW
jgi:hypothetical protein